MHKWLITRNGRAIACAGTIAETLADALILIEKQKHETK